MKDAQWRGHKRGGHVRSRHERGYGSAWVKLRLLALKRDGYLCQPCLRNDKTTIATEVDHIKPKAKGGKDEIGNLQSICHECHKAKTAQENKREPLTGEDGWPVWTPTGGVSRF